MNTFRDVLPVALTKWTARSTSRFCGDRVRLRTTKPIDHAAANRHATRLETDVFDGDRRFPAVTEKPQRVVRSTLHRAPQRMLDERAPFVGRVLEPCRARPDQQLGVDLAQIVEIVGHAPTDDGSGIVFQQIEQLEDPFGVLVEPSHTRGPRQAQPRAFRHETANVRVLVLRPRAKDGERPLGVLRDVGADAEFRAEPARELVLRLHRELEVIESAFSDEHQVRHVEERRHPGAHELIRLMLGTKRPQDHVDRLGIRRG